MNEEAFNLVKGGLSRRGQMTLSRERFKPSKMDIDDLFLERITPDSDLPPMQPLFKMFDVPCFYRGELVADCGKAKSGKTYFLSILMAATQKRQMLALERISETPLKVLWIDTEQSQQSTQEIMKDRIMPLAGIEQLDDQQFYAFNLRGLGFEKRGRMVDVAINAIQPDIAIVDGIKDLMTDINDAVQATLIMEKLMALAQEYKCCIVCVLHLNKSEQDWNMRGSIGTELTNKAFEVFQCEMLNETDTFKVTHTYSRKQRMKRKFYYRVNEQGLPMMCADYHEQPRDDQGRFMSKKALNVEVDPNIDLQKMFTAAMEGREQRRYAEVMGYVMKKCGVPDRQTYYAYFEMAEEQKIIRKEENDGTTWVELIMNTLPF